jgi:hypothetical protein
LRGWKKVRAKGGLRGWIRCSDGRLYHPVVVEKAIEAWAKRKTYSRNGSKGAAKRWGETDSQAIPADSKSHGLTIDLPMAKNSKGQRQGEVRDKEAPATPITQSNSEKPSPVGAPVVRKMNGDGDGEGGGRFGGELNAENRIQFAIQKALPFLPGRDDSDRWIVAQAAEDPKDPNHAKAVTAMLKATKQARVGWISPERRTVTGKTRNNLGKATKHTVSYAGS